ncbi:MAG TPA: hypothetical protein VGI39_20065, partial [Polyangiaceae bacterium]
MSVELSRRAALSGGAALAVLASLKPAAARGRMPVGGSIALHLPWPLAAIDPHHGDDVTAAVIGESLFDPLYALSPSGGFTPALAESDPEPSRNGLRVPLRTGL